VPADHEAEKKRVLKELFTSLMTVDQDTASTVVQSLVDRLSRAERELTPRERLVLRLQDEYPLDIGVLSSYLLNYVCLESGEAIALGANEPHAYLAGELVECMVRPFVSLSDFDSLPHFHSLTHSLTLSLSHSERFRRPLTTSSGQG